MRLFGCRDTEAHGTGNVRIFPDQLDDCADIRGNLCPCAGHAKTRYDIDKAFRLFCNHGDPVLGCGRDQGDQRYMILAAQVGKLLLFFKGKIRQDQTVDADLRAGFDKNFRIIGKDNVGICHKYHRNSHVFAQVTYQIKDLVSGGAACKRAHIRLLNDRSLGRGIGERDAELNEICACIYHGAHHLCGRFQIRIAACDERNKCLSVSECFCNSFSHGYPPLCNGRWRRSPCRLCRRS